jgi:magnesium transporter
MLISCVAYEEGKKLADVPVTSIQDYRQRQGCFVWVALADPDETELNAMQAAFDLHPLAVEDAVLGHQRPKIEEYGDAMFAVLHVVEAGAEQLAVGELEIFAGPGYIVTARKRVQKGFAEVRARAEREPDFMRQGSGYILYALIDAVVDRYFPLLDALESDLDQVEERIFAPEGVARENVEDLYALKQRLQVMKHAVAPLLEAVSNLTGGRVPMLCNRMTEYFRDIYDHLARLNQTTDSLRDTITTAISVNLSMVTLREGETMKQLAAYAALLAVPTMVAGIYGMNFEHMPELKWTYGYPLALGAMVLLDAILWLRFKKARWL